ncbi:MAG TPA: PqiC family protein [Acetobacteraceae bacterium]|nr:PqiC family protein [Acetobacteraceae bacterium]
MVRRRALLILAAAPVGCAPGQKLYTLVDVPGPPRDKGPPAVELRDVSLAEYLTRTQIVRSTDDVQLQVLADAQWGERFSAMLTRILVQELAERLPGTAVFAKGGAISGNPTSSVDINVQRLDADRAGSVVLLAQIAVVGHNASMRTVRLTAPLPSPETPDLITAMSAATGQLADTIAEMLEVPPAETKREATEIRRLKRRLTHVQSERDTLKKAVDTLSDMQKQ